MVRGLLGIVAVVACGMAAAEPPVLEPASSRTNFFAGREATLGTVVRGGDPVAGRLAWSLTAFGRTLAGGAVDVRHDGGRGTAADVVVVVPEVKAGVCVTATFTAVLVAAAGQRLAAHTRPVRMFPADPFVDRIDWLESLRLALIDPVGDTERVLAAAGVPFTLVRSEADIVAAAPQIIVVGEGTAWRDRPDLPALVTRFAARGVPVLALAPRDAELPLPDTADEPGEVVARSLVLRRADVVADLDDRLDWRDWSAAGDTVVSRLTVAADGAALLVQARDAAGGWPWLEAAFASREADPPAGKLVICGLGIVTHWDESPAARYLCAALLERLTRSRLVPLPGAGPPLPIVAPPTNPSQETEP